MSRDQIALSVSLSYGVTRAYILSLVVAVRYQRVVMPYYYTLEIIE